MLCLVRRRRGGEVDIESVPCGATRDTVGLTGSTPVRYIRPTNGRRMHQFVLHDPLLVAVLERIWTQLTAMDQRMSAVQNKVDELTAMVAGLSTTMADAASGLSTSLAGLTADIQGLKDKIAANQPPDFTALDANLAGLSAGVNALQTAANQLKALDETTPPVTQP